MTDMITVTGVVATEPTKFVTSAAVPITSFRLASNQRRYDRGKQEWVDVGTNWYGVSAFRALALHALVSLHKGERVVVTGRLKVREWTAGEKNGTAVEIDAESIGHDLTFGTSMFTRSAVSGNQQQADPQAAVPSHYDGAPTGDARESDVIGGDEREGAEEQDADGQPSAEREHAAAHAAESTLSATPF
ncbi:MULTISPECIES: single-stranded DNA-binding protein [unclassified Diaminobutyricimonas]|uniref:single-stranded DNA-binding protein n=1 Tax=unclassified Diaminobutyricimonas TaxID=2643261 RepID=UPI0012F50CE1|nr:MULTISPECIES: single-stranded DNA-binding protein [unclassified Diaminobutyricimonas]